MAEQIVLPFALNEEKLKAFLTQWVTIEDEEDRLREEKRLLKEGAQDHMPLRAVLAAVKIVRAREKLIHHPKEPMERIHFAVLETLVEQRLTGLAAAMEDALKAAEALAQRKPGDMVGAG